MHLNTLSVHIRSFPEYVSSCNVNLEPHGVARACAEHCSCLSVLQTATILVLLTYLWKPPYLYWDAQVHEHTRNMLLAAM